MFTLIYPRHFRKCAQYFWNWLFTLYYPVLPSRTPNIWTLGAWHQLNILRGTGATCIQYIISIWNLYSYLSYLSFLIVCFYRYLMILATNLTVQNGLFYFVMAIKKSSIEMTPNGVGKINFESNTFWRRYSSVNKRHALWRTSKKVEPQASDRKTAYELYLNWLLNYKHKSVTGTCQYKFTSFLHYN